MIYLTVVFTALLASGLTFVSGFGLGTLLLPAFSMFFPVSIAVVLTAFVHFLNGLFKLVLVGRHASWRVVVRFGAPAVLAALAGARVLAWLSDRPPWLVYALGTRQLQVLPVKVVVAVLMIFFALVELSRRVKTASVDVRYLPLGGIVSGFFGGLSGHQGAFRSVFLLCAGLDKETFIGTGVAIAAVIDLSRISVYLGGGAIEPLRANAGLVSVACVAAFAGALLGNRLLKKITLRGVQVAIAAMLTIIAIGLGSGFI